VVEDQVQMKIKRDEEEMQENTKGKRLALKPQQSYC